MKITDKIVTSITLPQQTNVLWHNPETGELKMFGNTGWEVAGGGKLPELPEIVESGWVFDKETLGIASRSISELLNTCSYKSSYGPNYEGWEFVDNPTLSVGESIELSEVGTDNKVTVVVIGTVGGPYTGYKFEGNLDTNKIYSYGTYKVGFTNTASAEGAVASGNGCIASGKYSHAEGESTTASEWASHAEGRGTIASSESQHVQGRYNIDDPNDVYQFIIGNGNGTTSRSNALAVKWDGTIVLWKDVNTPLELTPAKLEALLALVD